MSATPASTMAGASAEWHQRAWRALLTGVMTLFLVNVGLIIAAVATSSFARRWLGTWLPDGWTGAMMGMMTLVRVLPPDKYDRMMALIKEGKYEPGPTWPNKKNTHQHNG